MSGKNSVKNSTEVYDDGLLRVEHDNYFVSCKGEAVKLTRIEFLLLSQLVKTPERIVTAAMLWQNLWSCDKPLNLDSLHVQISRLRHKVCPFGIRIEAMVNVGYRFMPSKSASLL